MEIMQLWRLTCILEVLCERVCLLLGLERGELQTERAAVLVGQEEVELGGVRVEPRHEVLCAVQLDGRDTLACRHGKNYVQYRCCSDWE